MTFSIENFSVANFLGVTRTGLTTGGYATIAVTMLVSLTGCQTSTSPTDYGSKYTQKYVPKAAVTQRSSAFVTTNPAHDLMQYTMLHRFDKSYAFDKVTQYKAFSLYHATADNAPKSGAADIEAADESVVTLFLRQISSGKKHHNPTKSTKTRQLSPEQLACETRYTREFDATLDDYSDDIITENQVTTAQNEELARYQACMAAAPTADTKNTTASNISDTNDQDQKRPSDYQDFLKKIIAGLDDIDANQAHEKAKAQAKLNNVLAKNASDKNLEKSGSDTTNTDTSGKSRQKFTQLFGNMSITPEQIEVLNQTYFGNHTLHYTGFYNQATGQYSTIFEENRQRAGAENYRRMPVLLDLNQMSVTLEPDVALPYASIMFDKQLPESVAGKSIKFTLPAKLRQSIPLPILKDSLVSAIGQAYGDIEPEKFSEVVLDDYARNLHASREIKINMGTQELGFVFGRAVKYWAANLNQIATAHPEYIKNNADFQLSLAVLTKLNRHYRADDLAHLAQLAEAFLPMNFNGYNYYYFDAHNQLIGYRKNKDYRSSLFNAKIVAITTNKINYNFANSHKNFYPSHFYDPKPADIVDGNTLMTDMANDKKREIAARDARFNYDMGENTEKTPLPPDEMAATKAAADVTKDAKEIDTIDAEVSETDTTTDAPKTIDPDKHNANVKLSKSVGSKSPD